jgi:hypothetical protein
MRAQSCREPERNASRMTVVHVGWGIDSRKIE